MSVYLRQVPSFRVSVLQAAEAAIADETKREGKHNHAGKESPPLDPAYVAEFDSHGRIVHRIEKAAIERDQQSLQPPKTSSDNDKDDATAVFAPPDIATGHDRQEQEQQQQQPRTSAFPTPTIDTLTDETVIGAETAPRGKTQILSLSEARQRREKEEEESRRRRQAGGDNDSSQGKDDARKEQTIGQLLAQNAMQTEHNHIAEKTEESRPPTLQTLRAQEWRYWSSMPTAINRFNDEWNRKVCQTECAACKQQICTSPCSGAPAALSSSSSGAIGQPWNAELAADDIDLCAVRCMRDAAEKQMVQCAKQVRQTGDAWMLLPCQHVLHGFPCAMHYITSEKRDCPQCNERVLHIAKAVDAMLGKQDSDKTRGADWRAAQNAWILNTIECPPSLLKEDGATKCLDILACKCERFGKADDAQVDTTSASVGSAHAGTIKESADSLTSAMINPGARKSRQHLLEVIDKAQQRLVRKYVLLDRMQSALDAEDTSQFKTAIDELQLLVPRDSRQHLWQVLEPPREHRPNVHRAVALAKSAAPLSSATLQWLSDHGFLDEDTMTALVPDLDEQWFGSLTDASQRILLEQAMKTATLQKWNASMAGHVRTPATLKDLAVRRDEAPTMLEWASAAERNGRFAVAVEMRDLASRADADE